MDTKQILNNWSKPKTRSDEKILISARLEYVTYARLHALKASFPSNSINKFINDILETGLDSIVADLGLPDRGGEPIMHSDLEILPDHIEDEIAHYTTPNSAHLFNVAYNDIMANGKESEFLKSSKSSEEK